VGRRGALLIGEVLHQKGEKCPKQKGENLMLKEPSNQQLQKGEKGESGKKNCLVSGVLREKDGWVKRHPTGEGENLRDHPWEKNSGA